MGLKPKRFVKTVIGDWTMGVTASKGMAVIRNNDTSVKLAGTLASGNYPMGILLNDVISADFAAVPQNLHADEVATGSKVAVVRNGVVLTDQIITGVTIAAGDRAYISSSGLLSNAFNTALDATAPDEWYQIGFWLSAEDSDGYALLEVNIQS